MSQKRVRLMEGDCLDWLRRLEDASVDSIVTDPPYGLAFMGKSWDKSLPGIEHYQECLRVLKPGGHLLAFGGSRTYHRTACAIEDAGFEIRDCIMWIYGSGFPKSANVSNAIDKAAGALQHEGRGMQYDAGTGTASYRPTIDPRLYQRPAPATPEAARWQGWGTALKPAHEPIVMARKPLAGTVAANVLEHGTGALNIDGCRIGNTVKTWPKSRSFTSGISSGYTDGIAKGPTQSTGDAPAGRWPANVIHDGSACVVEAMPERTPRFFYCAKVSKAEREAGVAGVAGVGALRDGGRPSVPRVNNHPTVKPVALMRYLCRLVTPPDGVTLDPFMGSGTTGVAAVLEGFRFVGIEREAEYCAIARQRIRGVLGLFGGCLEVVADE